MRRRLMLVQHDYVKDGLIIHLDGIDNTKNGYNPNAKAWEDLSGNGNDFILNGFDNVNTSGWRSNGLLFDDRNTYTSPIINLPEQCTISIVLKIKTSDKYGIVLYCGNTINKLSYRNDGGDSSNRLYIYNDLYTSLYTNSIIPLEKTVCFTIVQNNDSLKYYINGVFDNEGVNRINSISFNTSYSSIVSSKLSMLVNSLMVHDNCLSSYDVMKNYQYLKKRFNL